MTINEDLDLDPKTIANAQIGDSSAQLTVDIAYYHATRVENNCYKAFKWINESAEQGYIEAQFRLADMYVLGHGTARNLESAHEWYTKSALQDYPKALIRIHNLYVEDKKIHSRGELSSEEEGMNELEFKKSNSVRELNEYRLNLLQAKNILGGTMEFFLEKFKALRESKIDNEDINHTLGFLYKHGYGVRKITKRAIVFYTNAAEKGHTSAQYNLAYLYQHSHDIKFNYRHAFKWHSKAAEGGSSAAQNNLGYFYEKGLVVDVDFQKALHWYTQAAQKNNKGAMLNIARLYRKGFLNDPYHSELIRWYTLAAEKGSLVAKNCLSLLSQKANITDSVYHTDGTFVEDEPSVKSRLHSRLRLEISNVTDPEKRNQMEKLASHALVGDGLAMLEIGFKYFDGIDLTQDKDIGFKWIQKAARANIIKARLIVAKMYEEGEAGVVKQDYYKAFFWYSLAAKQKNNVAQYKIGSLYFKGYGVRKDPLEASKWFIWSADQGYSNAQCMLGIMRLEEGGVLRKDPAEAFEWFTKSASQRNAKALYQLGQMYWEGKAFENGKPIGKSEKRAILFYKYAACHGDIDSGLLLAKMYSEGNAYIDRNFFEALEYYLKVSKQGDSGSMYKAGCMLLEGDTGVQDHIKAFKLINQAAKNGSYEAQGLFDIPLVYSPSITDYANVLDMFKVVTFTKIADLRYNIGCFYEYGIHGFNNATLIKPNLEKALEWYTKAAKKNNPDALYKIGLIHQEGKIVERNISTAVEYYTTASKFFNIDSLFTLATIYLLGIDVDKDVVQAFLLYFEAACIGHQKSRNLLSMIYGFEERNGNIYMNLEVKNMIEEMAGTGNIIAQYYIGVYYESCRNLESAIKWYLLAAQGKVTEACFKLGKIYEESDKYKDYSKSMELYELAIENGHDNALFRLARMYHYGKGVPRDYLKAFQMYNDASDLGNKPAYRVLNISDEHDDNINEEAKKSSLSLKEFQECLLMYEHVAANGNVDFQYKVGYIYEKVLEPPEHQNAFKWYTMATCNSNGEAACRLGKMYAEGKGVPQDWSIAIKYFNQSILLGSHYGCFHLGQVYHKDVNISKALEYYHKAAEQSNPDAQFMLGQLYESSGEQNNLIESLIWYTKAYLQGQEDAITRLYDLEDNEDEDVQYSYKILDKFQKFADGHGGKRKDGDPDYYGLKYYRLASMYFYGIATDVNYKKAWKYFDIARQEYKNKESIDFINSITQVTDGSQTLASQKLIEMFNIVLEDLDKDLLYNIGNAYYIGSSFNGLNHSTSNIFYSSIQQNYSETFKFLQKSLKKGNLKAQKMLLKIHTYGIGTEQHLEVAIRNHNTLAEKQDYFDNFELGLVYYRVIENNETSYSIALIYFQKAAEQGYADAQKYLGDMYYYGYGVKPDLENSIKLHKLSASQRSASENFDIGSQYYNGSINLKKSFLVALIYFSRSISRKTLDSQRYIEDICCYRNKDIDFDNIIHSDDDKKLFQLHKYFGSFLDGDLSFRIGFRYYQAFERVEKNYLIAIIYLKRAVNQGNAEAQRYLGDMYYYGYGVKKDESKAFELHMLSINQRNNEDRTFIGRQYYQGSDFATKNYSIAYKYFTEAANEEYYEARRYLGDMYYHGHYVKKDHEKAFELHKRLANQQNSQDNYSMGHEYYLGSINNKQDYIVALIYLNQSVNQGCHLAEEEILNICYSFETELEVHGTFSNHLNGHSNFNVGQAYYHEKNHTNTRSTISFIYFSKAAALNYYAAQRYIADMYYYGEGVKENRKKAIELHTHSADQKQDFDNYKTGQSYYHGDKNTRKNHSVAFIYFKKATAQNHLEAQRYLADMYYYGESVAQNREEAIRRHNFLAEQKEGVDNYKAGQLYYRSDNHVQKNYFIAFIYFSKAAAQNHVEAQRYLADMFYYGEGVELNCEKAIEIHNSLANQEQGFSNYETGQRYYQGKKKIPKNMLVALIYFRKAASQNHPGALRHLANIYYYGESVEKNHEKAIELYTSSIEQGEGFDNYETGRLYYLGIRGYKKNLEIASIYFDKAASQNHLEAQRLLADMYYYGEGIKKSHEEAIKLHKDLAERKRENGFDNYEKGQLYYYGNSNTKKSLTIALIYFSEAADENHSGAQRFLADIHYYGESIKQNREKAINLYTSSAKGSQGAENYDTGQSYYYGYGKVKVNRTVAFIFFRQAVIQNHPEAQRFLADRYYYDENVEKNREKAIELYTYSAKQGQDFENYKIGHGYYHGGINFSAAFIYFNEATTQNHPEAQRYLAHMYYYGESVEENREKAIKLYKSSAEVGSSSGNYEAGQLYYNGKGNIQKNLEIALMYFSKAATQKHHGAQRYLADMYYYGEGVEKNRGKAIKLYKSSAEVGNKSDNYEAGQLYYNGEGNIQKNLAVALMYFSKAATQNHLEAQRYLADMYYYGEGVEENRKKAIKLYKSSAELGDRLDNYRFGQLYFDGEGIIQRNPEIALIYFNKAATQNHLEAQRYLADMYYYGEGVEKNRKKAIALYKSSAELGDRLDNYRFGQLYFDGEGIIQRNPEIALIYFNKAATHNHLGAQRYIAHLYYYGEGVEKNREKAIKIYKSSANKSASFHNYETGRLYYDGKGNIQKNLEIALMYFSKAATQKHHGAQRYLADMYYYGEGVEKNRGKAIKLYKSSAEVGNKSDNYEAGQLYYNGEGNIQKNLAVALMYFSKAATQNHHGAQRYLANMNYYGEGVEKNEEKARELYESSSS